MEEIFNIATFDIPYFDFSYLPESMWLIPRDEEGEEARKYDFRKWSEGL